MNYPGEMKRAMDEDAAYMVKMQAIQREGFGPSINFSGALQATDARQPVDVSMGRLFELLDHLEAETDVLMSRLGPVSRPDSTACDAKSAGCAPSACQMVDMLDQAAARVEKSIDRLINARSRLCI